MPKHDYFSRLWEGTFVASGISDIRPDYFFPRPGHRAVHTWLCKDPVPVHNPVCVLSRGWLIVSLARALMRHPAG